MVDVGDKDAQDWKVHNDTVPEIKNAPSDDNRSNFRLDWLREGYYPQGEGSSIFSELKANKSVDKKTPASCGRQSALHSNKVRKHDGYERHDSRVKNEGDNSESDIQVKEGDDFLPSNRRVFRSNVEDHDRRHYQGDDMDKVSCYHQNVSSARRVTGLEDEGVCELDVSGIADWFDASACSDEGT